MMFEQAPTLRRRDVALLLLLLAVLFAVFEFALPGGWPHPIRPDDYSNVAGEWSDMALRWKRPVSSNTIFLVSEFGMHASYGFLWLLAVVDAALVLLLVTRLFAVRPTPVMVLAFGAIVFSHASAFDHATYLGLVTNLVSHLFGLLAMFALLRAWREARWRWWVLAWAAYVLTALAKEDFLLPPPLLLAWLAVEDWRVARRGTHRVSADWRQRAVGSVVLLALGATVMAWSVHAHNPFIAGLVTPERSSPAYAVDLSPLALAAALRTLLFDFSPVASLVALAACVLLWWRHPARRLRVAWLVATVLALALPYALISANMPIFRTYAWLPWLAAITLVAIAAEGARAATAPTRPPQRRTLPYSIAMVVVAAGIATTQLSARAAHVDAYMREAALNRRIVDTLMQLRPQLRGAPAIGLVALGESSPWCGQDAHYVNRKLGFAGTRWRIFVDAPTRCYTQQAPNALRKQGINVAVLPRTSLCAQGALPVIEYASDGSGRLRRASEYCDGSARSPRDAALRTPPDS